MATLGPLRSRHVLSMTIATVMTAIAQVVELEGPGLAVGIKPTTNLGAGTDLQARPAPGRRLSRHAPVSIPRTRPTSRCWPSSIRGPGDGIADHLPNDHGHASRHLQCDPHQVSLKGMNQEDNLEADFEIEITACRLELRSI